MITVGDQTTLTGFMRYYIIGLITLSFCHPSLAVDKDYSQQLEKLKNKLNRYLDPDQLFKKIDKDKDSSVTLQEFGDQKAYRGQDDEKAKKTFVKIDTDKNDKISKAEFKAYRDKALNKVAKVIENVDTDKLNEAKQSIEKKPEAKAPETAPSVTPNTLDKKTAEKKPTSSKNSTPAQAPAPSPTQ